MKVALRYIAVVSCLSHLYLERVRAETVNWTNASGDSAWETALNWDPPLVPDSPFVSAQLAISAPSNLTSNRTVGSLGLTSMARLNLVTGSQLTIAAPDGSRSGAVLANDGLILVNTTDQNGFARVAFSGNNLITGNGFITLRGDNPGSFIDDGSVTVYNGTTIHAAGHTISGRGVVDVGPSGVFRNEGLILADQPSRKLELSLTYGPMVNSGVVSAINGATLLVPIGLLDQSSGGILQADGAGSVIQLGNLAGQSPHIADGELRTSSGGLFRAYAADLDGCTLAGQMEILVNGNMAPSVRISSGGLTNNGNIVVNANSGGAGFKIVGTATLDGSGSVQFNTNSPGNTVLAANGAATLHHGHNHLMHGAGYMDFNTSGVLVNDGIIRADQTGRGLGISRGGTHKNNGVIEAINGGAIGIEAPLDQTGGGSMVARGAGSSAVVYSDTNLTREIVGGTLRGEDGGVAELSGAALRNCSLFGDILAVSINSLSGFTFDGTINLFDSGTALRFSSGNIEGRGLIRLNGGSLQFTSITRSRRGQIIEGSGTLSVAMGASFINHSTIAPGTSGLPIGRIDWLRDVQLGSSSTVSIQIAGPSSFDQLRQIAFFFQDSSIPLKLGGTLQVDLIFGYVPAASDSFITINGKTTLQGTFENVVSGGRLNTARGAGSFQVDYAGSNNVVLSNYGAPLPVPVLDVTSTTRDLNGSFIMQGNGTPNTAFRIQAADDLDADFLTIGTAMTDANGTLTWIDSALAAQPTRRFYRAKYP